MESADQPTRFPAFRASLRAWVDAAWDLFKSRLDEAWRNPLPWVQEGANVIGSWSDPPTWLWPEKYTNEVLHLPQWEGVRSAIVTDPVLHRHASAVVGNALSRSAFSVNSIAFAFWPGEQLVANWGTGIDSVALRDGAFAKVYGPIEEFFTSTEEQYTVITPIAGLVCDRVPLRLDDDVELDQMTREEIVEVTARRVLRDAFGRPFTCDDLPVYFRYCLRRTLRTPRIVGDAPFDQAEGERLRTVPLMDHQRISRTLSVVLDNRLLPQAFIARQVGWSPGGGELSLPMIAYPFTNWTGKRAILARHDEAEVVHAWRLFGDPTFEQIGSLRIPVDRLAGLNLRTSAEDTLLDLAIAVEVFFRAGAAEGKRDGKRVRRRMMHFVDASDMAFDKAAVGEWSDRAYRMRNDLVHQGAVDVNDLPGEPDPFFRTVSYAAIGSNDSYWFGLT